jgi:WD40 repeat protein
MLNDRVIFGESFLSYFQGVCFSHDEILASYSGDAVYLFDLNETTPYMASRKTSDAEAQSIPSEQPKEQEDTDTLPNLSTEDLEAEGEDDDDMPKLVLDGEMESSNAVHASKSDTYKAKYDGHCNQRTVKSTAFFGPRDEYVLSGSDDGNIFIWNKKTSKLVNLLKGDEYEADDTVLFCSNLFVKLVCLFV